MLFATQKRLASVTWGCLLFFQNLTGRISSSLCFLFNGIRIATVQETLDSKRPGTFKLPRPTGGQSQYYRYAISSESWLVQLAGQHAPRKAARDRKIIAMPWTKDIISFAIWWTHTWTRKDVLRITWFLRLGGLWNLMMKTTNSRIQSFITFKRLFYVYWRSKRSDEASWNVAHKTRNRGW